MVSSMNAKVLSRTHRSSASISSFSPTISGSCGMGCLAPDYARLDNHHWNVKSFEKRD